MADSEAPIQEYSLRACGIELFYHLYSDKIRYSYTDSSLTFDLPITKIPSIRRRFHPRFRLGLRMFAGWLVAIILFVLFLPKQYFTAEAIYPLAVGLAVILGLLGKNWKIRNIYDLSGGKDGLLVIVDASNPAAAESFIESIKKLTAKTH